MSNTIQHAGITNMALVFTDSYKLYSHGVDAKEGVATLRHVVATFSDVPRATSLDTSVATLMDKH